MYIYIYEHGNFYLLSNRHAGAISNPSPPRDSTRRVNSLLDLLRSIDMSFVLFFGMANSNPSPPRDSTRRVNSLLDLLRSIDMSFVLFFGTANKCSVFRGVMFARVWKRMFCCADPKRKPASIVNRVTRPNDQVLHSRRSLSLRKDLFYPSNVLPVSSLPMMSQGYSPIPARLDSSLYI